MSELVALRIKIKRKFSGGQMQNDYPNFNALPDNVRDDMDWCCFIDQFTSWHYDKKSGFGESDSYNPDERTQYGIFCVPQSFADAALLMFSDAVEQVNESDFTWFYDDRAHAHESELRYDAEVLSGLRARYGTIPVVTAELAEFFTDTTEDDKDAKIVEYEVAYLSGIKIKDKTKIKIDKLVEMEVSDRKAINPDHPSPGIRKNKDRFYADFKARKGFTIKAL